MGGKPHIVLILSGVIWCRYVALYAYGVFSFTYVINFIVIIDLTRCCFLQNGALALFGWAGVAGTVKGVAHRTSRATSRTAFWSRCWAPRTDAEWRRRCAYTHRKQCVQIWNLRIRCATPFTVCSRHCWGFYAEYFRVVDWPTLCPFLMRRYSIFFPSCCNVFSSDLCPHHFSTQTDAPDSE